jgi:hypothetical protein
MPPYCSHVSSAIIRAVRSDNLGQTLGAICIGIFEMMTAEAFISESYHARYLLTTAILSNVRFVALYNLVMLNNGFTGDAHTSQWMMLASSPNIFCSCRGS